MASMVETSPSIGTELDPLLGFCNILKKKCMENKKGNLA